MKTSMLETAMHAAKQAGIFLERELQQHIFSPKDRQGKDWHTIAEKQTEETIKHILLSAFPDHGFYGEETGGAPYRKRICLGC